MPAIIPTEEQLREEIRETLKANPKFKMCINCMHFGKVTHECAKYKRRVLPHVPGCKFYEAHEDALLKEALRDLHAQARECEKIEFLLAMALTSANTTTLFTEDFERRVRTVYKKEKDKATKRNLKKDLDLAEQMDSAMKKIAGFVRNLQENYKRCIEQFVQSAEKDLEGIDAQYRHYIQSHLDKIFKKGGTYNAEASDNLNYDSGQFALMLIEFARVAHHNMENGDKVFATMEAMENINAEGLPNSFCLDKKDKDHYILKDR